MTREDPEFGAEQMGALFRTALDQPEPAAPVVVPEVRRAGARLRLRRRVLTVTAVAAAVATVATLGVTVGGRPEPSATAAAPTASGSPPASGTPTAGPSGSAAPTPTATAAPTPEHLVEDWRLNAVGHQNLLTWLREHPLPGFAGRVEEGGHASVFRLLREDGGEGNVLRIFEGWARTPEERMSPCGPRTNGDLLRDCAGRTLPDGTVLWAAYPAYRDRPGGTVLMVITAERHRRITVNLNPGSTDGTPRTPLTPEQALDVAARPGFVQAVDEGWRDWKLG
ncbi:hypothetical protein ACWEQL_30895 [Kitasatospora sp. NPDC004240]